MSLLKRLQPSRLAAAKRMGETLVVGLLWMGCSGESDPADLDAAVVGDTRDGGGTTGDGDGASERDGGPAARDASSDTTDPVDPVDPADPIDAGDGGDGGKPSTSCADDCDDGLPCNGVEVCVDGVCQRGQGPDCDDAVACTADLCDEGTGECIHTPDHGSCDNGLRCDGIEQCDPVGGCRPAAVHGCIEPTPHCDEKNNRCAAGHVLVGAGDIADGAALAPAEYTADLVSSVLASESNVTVFTLGDNVYDVGTASNYVDYYEPTWGVFKDVTRPVMGNHDYGYGGVPYENYDSNGLAYQEYFAGQFVYGNGGGHGAAPPVMLPDGTFSDPLTTETEGIYYSYDVGEFWHVVVLDSQCTRVPGFRGCRYEGVGDPLNSAQAEWLIADLDGSARPCTAVMWHHPRWSSGVHGDNDHYSPDGGNSLMDQMWRIVVDRDVDVLLGGHDHHYERFHPLDADGNIAPATGVRQFVVGTGGRFLYDGTASRAITAVFDDTSFGVLRLVLLEDSYQWEFIGGGSARGDGANVLDSGWTACH